MSAATRRILVAAAVSLALSVVGSSSARANGGPSSPTRLDRATASVLAQDLAFIDAADQSVDVERCIRIPGEPLRVDCVMEFGFDGPENANVYVIVITGERVSADVYSARLRSRYTKASSIQTSPAAFRPVLIQEFYRGTGFRYEPSRLARDDAGWGEPKLPELIRRQCALQPRLPCRR